MRSLLDMDRYPRPSRDPLRLDDGTADRLLRGLPPDDAPRAYRRVAAMVAGLTAAPTAEELDGDLQAVTTIARRARTASEASRSASAPRSRNRRMRTAGFVLACSATLVAGLGAAGALPGAAQTVASDVLASVGVSTPGPDANAGTHPDQPGDPGSTGATGSDAVHPNAPGASSADGATNGAGGSSASSGSNGKGSTISDLAQDDTTTGVDKGAAVSSVASDDQSNAGQNAGAPPVTTPSGEDPAGNPGGNGNGNGNANGNAVEQDNSQDK
jgi:hypothetical protein